MTTADRHTDADVETVRLAVGDCQYDDMSDEQACAVLDALTAAGWAPRAQVADVDEG